MPIIDKKGMLFGKINLFDFIVILVLVSFLPVGGFVYKLLHKKHAPFKVELVETEMSALLIKVKPEMQSAIRTHDRELDSNGAVIGELVSVGEPVPLKYIVDLGNQERSILRDSVLKEIPVKIKLKVQVMEGSIYYNGQRLTIGVPFRFLSRSYEVEAVPTVNRPPTRWVEVNVRFSSLTPEIVTVIKEGHLEKNNEGMIIGKLNKILSSSPSQVQAVKIEDNRMLFFNDPYSNDITAALELLCSEQDGEIYFKKYPVKIGSQITFASDLYIVSGKITSFSFIKQP